MDKKYIISSLGNIADQFDSRGMFGEADSLVLIMKRLSQVEKPRVLLIEVEAGDKESKGLWGIREEDLRELKSICDLDYVQVKSMTEEELADKCAGYDYLMLNMDFLPSYPDKMEKLTKKFYSKKSIKNLKGINVDMTDADFFSPWECQKLGITLQTCPDAVTDSVAESSVSEILLHARMRHLAYQDEISGKAVECRKGINLRGKTAGVIGYGHIGKQVAKMLRGIGMNVLVHEVENASVESSSLEKIFKEACVISVHAPALQNNKDNTSNIDLIDSKLLNLCNECILINLATDIIVNTDDLISAIESGKIIGYSYEPGRKVSDKLKKYPEVHVSPCSYDSDESRDNVKRIWINNMISMIKGKPNNVWVGSK